MAVTQQYLKDNFYYADGFLHRKEKTSNAAHLDSTKLVPSARGYYYICILGKKRQMHRMIYLYHNGTLPKELDHIDGNPLNNKIENLRPCTSTQNKFNTRIRSDNSSGIKGVYWERQREKWRARIQKNGAVYDLGFFDNLFDAACTVIPMREKLHGDFANIGG